MTKYNDKNLTNTEEADLTKLETTQGRQESSNTTEPATHVNRHAERAGFTAQQIRALERLEERDLHGAPSLSQKSSMFNVPQSTRDANPGMEFRWINIANKDKVDARIEEGYAKIEQERGGVQLGDSFALFGIPRQLRDSRVNREARVNEERLGTANDSFKEAGERAVHEMKKRYGLSDREAKRLIINE